MVTVQLSNVQLVLVVQIDQWHGTMLNHEEHRRMSSSTETQSTQSLSREFQFMLINCLEITACLFTIFRSTSLGGTSVLVMIASNRIWWMFTVSDMFAFLYSCLNYPSSTVRRCVCILPARGAVPSRWSPSSRGSFQRPMPLFWGNTNLTGCRLTFNYLFNARVTFVFYLL